MFVSIAVFWLYRTTLLPGVDFGDSGSIQTTVGSPLLTPRDGYPLYFGIGNALLALTHADPAYAMNMASSLEGALACGLFVVVATGLSGSVWAAVGGATLFAVSYTFWSQGVTAEVYGLHMLCVLASLALLLRWERQPTTARLAAFFACYAIGFGNHLSMILLAPGFTAFLLLAEPRGWRFLLSPRIIALALGLALIGAAQYLWNLRTMWLLPQPPDGVWAAARTFWFDVTKSDWRETMVLNVPRSMLRDHAAMYWFDLRQQFGIGGVMAALVGALALGDTCVKRATLLALVYLVNVAFAFSYNVGDAHVFYLPSHLVVALLASVGASAAGTLLGGRGRGVAGLLLVAYAGVRGYLDFPALDRSRDWRAAGVLNALTANLDDQRAILFVDLNWQIANGLSYFASNVAPEVAVARLRDVLLYAPALIQSNLSGGREVVANEHAAKLLGLQYGPLIEIREERDAPRITLADTARNVSPGARYVLCVLKPSKDFTIDRNDVRTALGTLTGGAVVEMPAGDYAVVAGLAGSPPALAFGNDAPFRRRVHLADVSVQIRMDSWLSADTIRRMGFGHAVARHHHTLIIERGVSFATFGDDGNPQEQAYFANLFERPRRYDVRLGGHKE